MKNDLGERKDECRVGWGLFSGIQCIMKDIQIHSLVFMCSHIESGVFLCQKMSGCPWSIICNGEDFIQFFITTTPGENFETQKSSSIHKRNVHDRGNHHMLGAKGTSDGVMPAGDRVNDGTIIPGLVFGE